LKAVNKKKSRRQLKSYFNNKKLQQVLIGLVTIAIAVFVIENAAVPKKYRLETGMRSNFDITAPRDIENTILTEKLAEEEAEKISPVMLRLESVPIDIINSVNEFINNVRDARQRAGVTVQEQDSAEEALSQSIDKFSIPLSAEQVKYLVSGASDQEMDLFDELTISLISSVMKQEVNKDNLAARIDYVQNTYNNSSLPEELKSIGSLMANALIVPNSVIDEKLTREKKTDAYNAALENKQIILEGSRIISYGDIVTEDKLEVLRELNLLETGKFDFSFAGGILCIILILSFLLVLYLNNFCSRILSEIKELILLCTIILLTLLAAWVLNPVNPLFIPIFIAPMLISILLDLRLGILTNLLLALAISLITKGDAGFFYTAIIGGTCAAFIVKGASQRSRLSASGLAIAVINAIVIASVGLINKSGVAAIANNSAIVAINGILSIIFTIGTLPFFESTFNIITPLKLLELANPNQPLMKKLLMEAPGTYHHSLMVGNLAEAATEEINGNALLARVGAYYHDIGKLKRPNFFKENQLSENPHDRMTPNLSTLVITSHTTDGVEMAEKYKVPLAVRNIILQHHGTTLVAYFYYKAKKADKNDSVKQEDFRYQGPRPTSKEAAVVMLADSVEAAVRSMAEKTEGKMEGLIRKIIKDKLDDGQLDHCDLTLKDMDMIARAFMRVFGGYFHEREAYPELKVKQLQEDSESDGLDPLTEAIKEQSLLDDTEDKNDVNDEENRSVYERQQA
jgi:putative nucleotidyltransferase with HDIG domain